MNTVLRLIEYRRLSPVVHFSRHELMHLLGVYARQVSAGVWRDYALDAEAQVARFHVFRHAGERPALTIVKRREGSGLAADHSYALYAGDRRLMRAASFADILARLEAIPRGLDHAGRR